MPYQLRHVDETIVIDEQDSFDRFSLDRLFEIKLQEFEPQTRRFELLVMLCVGIAMVAAVTRLETMLLALFILAMTAGAVTYLLRRRGDGAKLTALVPVTSCWGLMRLRFIARRRRNKRPPFVNYA